MNVEDGLLPPAHEAVREDRPIRLERRGRSSARFPSAPPASRQRRSTSERARMIGEADQDGPNRKASRAEDREIQRERRRYVKLQESDKEKKFNK